MNTTEIKNKYPLAMSTLKFPVNFDDNGCYVFDIDNNMVGQIPWSVLNVGHGVVGKLIEMLLNDGNVQCLDTSFKKGSNEKFKGLLTPLFTHDNQDIMDSNGVLVCVVRGWGYIQKLRNAEEIMDEIGDLIVDLLNQYSFKYLKTTDG